MSKTSDPKALYCELLTAKIFASLDDIIDKKTTDKIFLQAQAKVRAIIASQYVEVDNPNQVKK